MTGETPIFPFGPSPPFAPKTRWYEKTSLGNDGELWMNKTLILLALPLLLLLRASAEVRVEQAADHAVTVNAPAYTAAFDATGDLTALAVKDAKVLTHKFCGLEKTPPAEVSVRVIGQMIAVRSGTARVEWTFADDSIHVLTEGYNFECQIDPTVKAVLAPGGAGGPFPQYAGGSTGLVLANGLTVQYSGIHVHMNRFLPAGYTGGGLKAGDLVEFEMKLGAPAEAAQFLSGLGIGAVGNRYGELSAGGNQGGGLVHFPGGVKIAFASVQQNLGKAPFELEYRLSVLDHYVAGKEVATDKRAATIEAGGKAAVEWAVPELPPGFYYLTLEAWRGTTKLTETRQTFAVDLAHCAHPLTRPADFAEFWKRQEARLKAVPPNPVLKLISVPALPDKAYEVLLDVPGGGKVRGCLLVPAKPGPGPAVFGSLLEKVLNDKMTQAAAPDFKAGDAVEFTIQLPEDGTYSRWTSADDNNLLQCVFHYLRAIDFLAARPEVNPQRIKVNGASRSGPLAVISAALRPDAICAVDAFVHTSAGLSWTDKPYSGWGMPGGHRPANAEQVAKLAAMAAYVDPVNHAPDVKCPIIFGYGVDDTLAPPQGIEAMYHLAGAAWKRISRDAGGHQYSNGYQLLQKELNTLLNAAGGGPDPTRTLKDH